jgi:hypothetical protein
MDEAFAALKKDYDFLQDKKKQLEEECDVNNDKIQEL